MAGHYCEITGSIMGLSFNLCSQISLTDGHVNCEHQFRQGLRGDERIVFLTYFYGMVLSG